MVWEDEGCCDCAVLCLSDILRLTSENPAESHSISCLDAPECALRVRSWVRLAGVGTVLDDGACIYFAYISMLR